MYQTPKLENAPKYSQLEKEEMEKSDIFCDEYRFGVAETERLHNTRLFVGRTTSCHCGPSSISQGNLKYIIVEKST